MRWSYKALDERKVLDMSRQLDLSATTASLLLRLGLNEPEAARRFLNPKLHYLDDPFRITHMDQAVERLRQAMARADPILVFGDYDVDGVTSTAFLVSVLHVFGIFPRYLVPLRKDEGYGLSRQAIDRALEEGPVRLLIAVDCGTNSCEEAEYLHRRGVDVIIIDHHTSKAQVPEQAIVVNPHVYDGEAEPWSDLCTVGLVFKFAHALIKTLRGEDDEVAQQFDLRDYLDLTAMGTIADLVSLRQENRILAKAGLERLRNTRRLGLSCLFEVSSITLGDEISPYDIGFRLGPRINASGRLDDASLPVQMILSENREECRKSAQLLDEFNRERQEIERHITAEAETLIEKEHSHDAGVILFGPDWHPGVVGIVASRLSMKYYRPCIVLGEDGGLAKGSGRSIPEVNLVEVLQTCAHLLDHWGGHPLAVGVSLPAENIHELQKAFNEAVRRVTGGRPAAPELEIHRWITPAEITEELLNELALLHPFGQGNPEPVFGLRGARLLQRPKLFGRGHFRFSMAAEQRRCVSGVAWKQADNPPPAGQPVDMAVKLAWNRFNNRSHIQAQLIAWRPAK